MLQWVCGTKMIKQGEPSLMASAANLNINNLPSLFASSFLLWGVACDTVGCGYFRVSYRVGYEIPSLQYNHQKQVQQ